MKIRILIADDSPTLREIIQIYLKEVGQKHEIVFSMATDGIEAETVLQDGLVMGEPIDILLLDWMMPNMTGLELLQKIRPLEPFKNKPQVIMLTAEGSKEHQEMCAPYRISAYMLKPFKKEELCAAVLQAIQGGSVCR